MKKFSKLLSLFVALSMVLSMGAFASGEPAGEASGESSAEPTAAVGAPVAPATGTNTSTADMTAAEYAYLANYSGRDDSGNIYVGNDVTASGEIVALDETVTGAGYTSVYVHGEDASATVTGTLVATDDDEGKLASDFSGLGSAIVAYDGATLTVEDAEVYTKGIERTGVLVSQNANAIIKNSTFTVLGANPLTDTYEGYHNSADQNWMISPPWPLGISGAARGVNMIGENPTLTVIDSTFNVGAWAILSTDSGSNMIINVVDSELNILPESEGGLDSGWRIFGYDEDAYGTGYGSYYIGNPTQNYYGATISGVTYAAIITGATKGLYTSSNGSIDLYDANGDLIETVEGAGQPTVINSVFGFMQHNALSDGIYVLDGTTINAADAIVIYKAGNGNYVFDDAVLNSDKGVLFQMIDNDDDSRIGGSPMSVDDGFSSTYDESNLASSEPGFPGITYDYESSVGGNTVTVSYTNGEYNGNLYNGTGYYTQTGDDLVVTLGENAVLNGDVALTSTIKGIKYSPEAIEGIEYYGDDITYVLLDAEGNITEDADEAAFIQFQTYTINEYFLQGHVENLVHYNGASTAEVVVEAGAEWNVADESLLTSLTVEDGAVVKGTVTENADGTVTLTASNDVVAAGVYGGTIEAVGGGVSEGGGVDASGVLHLGGGDEEEADASDETASAEPAALSTDAAAAVIFASSLSAEASAEPAESETIIIIDGQEYILTVYVIDGEEYVKLADLASLFGGEASDEADVTWADYQEYLIAAAGGNAPDLQEFQDQVYAMNSWEDLDQTASPWDQLFTTVGISTWADFVAAGGNGTASQVEGSQG
jgi:hypothetical protein